MATPLVAQITTNTSHIRELEAAVAELKARCEQRDRENARLIAELEATAQNLTAMWRLVAGPDPITEEAMSAALGGSGLTAPPRSGSGQSTPVASSPPPQWSTPAAQVTAETGAPIRSPPTHATASMRSPAPAPDVTPAVDERMPPPAPQPPPHQQQEQPQPPSQPEAQPRASQPAREAVPPLPEPRAQPVTARQAEPAPHADNASLQPAISMPTSEPHAPAPVPPSTAQPTEHASADSPPHLSVSRTPDVDLSGVWALTQSIKFKEYLEATGVPWAKRQVAIKLKPVQEWVQLDPDVWEFSMQTPIGKKTETLIVGGTTEDEIDGQPVLKETFWEGEVLVTQCRPRDRSRTEVKLTEFRRRLDKRNDRLILDIVTGEARCTRIFERQRPK